MNNIGPPSATKVAECEGCRYDTKLTKAVDRESSEGKVFWLCDFCLGAFWNGVPIQDSLVTMIGWAGNVLRDSLRREIRNNVGE